MTKTALLVVTKPSRALRILPKIKDYITNTLYILLLSENKLHHFNVEYNNVNKKLGSSSKYSSSIVKLYTDTLHTNLDIRVLLSGLRDPFTTEVCTKNWVEIIYFDQSLNKSELQKYVSSRVKNRTTNCDVIPVNEPDEDSSVESGESINTFSKSDIVYNYVVLGGTFDRLHTGHKILLSEAVVHCQKKLTVGVTDVEMLRSG